MKKCCYFFLILWSAAIFSKNEEVQNKIDDKTDALLQSEKIENDLTKWKPLFNGSDLSGWIIFLGNRAINEAITTDRNTQSVFKVEDNTIHIYKDFSEESIVPEGFLVTNKEYGNYHLKFEFKWGNKKFAQRVNKKRNSGVMFHAQDTVGFWPTSVECQVMEGDVGDIYTQNNAWITTTIDSIFTDSLTNKIYARYSKKGIKYEYGGAGSRRLQNDKRLDLSIGWNSVEIIVKGNEAAFIVNGEINNRLWNIRYIDPSNHNAGKPLFKGRIILQAEASEIFYRNIMIKEE